ncbi:MAG TPA: sigma-70 family RNA polymerase sigma factor [Polyangia bacterium]|nr:sigma-70 family RNA polymerase sigma factor [Polyangia bacterium]
MLRTAAWARRLARSLISDDALADDITQDIGAATASRPPGSADDPGEPLAGHKLLVEAVRALAEPYRRMILLRYFEGHSLAEIGSRDKFAPETVGGRLKVAVEILREVLDRRCGGRVLWVAPLTELSGPAAPSAPGTGGMASGSIPIPIPTPFGRGARVIVVGAAVAVMVTGVVWLARAPARRAQVNAAEQAGLSVAVREPPRAAVVANDEAVRKVEQRERSSPASDGAAAADEDDGPCKIATIGRGPVGEACRTGGRGGAKKLMKSLVSESKRRGSKFACDSCHQDLDSYALATGAQENLVKMLVMAGPQHQ